MGYDDLQEGSTGREHAVDGTPEPDDAATAVPTAHRPVRSLGRRILRLIRHMAVLLIMALVVEYAVLPLIPGIKKSLHALGSANVGILVLGLGLEVAALVAYVQLTHTVMPDPKPRRTRLARINLSTLALSHIVPGGTGPGTALGYRLLTQEDVTPVNATYALTIQGVGSAIVLNGIFWVALVVSIPLYGYQPLYGIAAGIGTLMLAIFGAVVYLTMKGRERTVQLAGRLARKIPLLPEAKLTNLLRQIADRFHSLLVNPRLMRRAIMWAAANWLLDAASLWVFILAFGKTLMPIDLLVAYGLANILAVLPITPGGLGIIEGVLIPTLHGFGVPKTAAILAVLGYRFVNFWLPIPAGGITYLSLRVSRRNGHGRLRDRDLFGPAGPA